jgi:Protein of unknown function (DUF3592)
VFDFFVGASQAYNQVGMFIGAIVCLGLGGLILGNSLYWRIHALRASGTIVGVISKSGSYTPVYRYTLPDGQTHVAKSNTSSGAVRGKETGRVVPLMISAHNPTEAQDTDSYLFDVIGLVLIVPGVWFGYTALTAYPITPMTWIMAVAMLVYLAERGHRVLIPKGQRLSVAEWRKQHGLGGAAAIDLTDVKPIEDIVSAPDVQQAQLQSSKKMVPFIGLFAAALVCLAIFQGMKIAHLEAVGLRAPGQVVRLKEESSSGHSTYYAVVEFRTDRNESVEFKDNVGSNPPGHRPGDKVTVLYLADHPREEAIIDRGLWWNWGIPGIVILVAAFLVWFLVVTRRSGTLLPPRPVAGSLPQGAPQGPT